jgi:hypothetical protein
VNHTFVLPHLRPSLLNSSGVSEHLHGLIVPDETPFFPCCTRLRQDLPKSSEPWFNLVRRF